MKKILSLSLLLSSALFASHEEGIRWGIGGRAGIATFTGKICEAEAVNRNTAANTAQVPTTNISQVTGFIKPGAVSFQGGAFGEVGYRSCDFSYGALIDVNGDTLKTTIVNSTQTGIQPIAGIAPANNQALSQFCLKARLHIGGDLRAGKYFGDTLWYVLIGGEGIRFCYNRYFSDGTLLAAQNAADPTSSKPVIIGVPCLNNNGSCPTSTACSTSSNTTDITCCNCFWRGALRVGTGLEFNWSDCLNIKLEYRFLVARKKQLCLASAVTSGWVNQAATNAQILATNTLYFRQNITALMLSYQF